MGFLIIPEAGLSSPSRFTKNCANRLEQYRT